MIDAHRHFWRYSPAEHAWIDDSMPMLKRDFLPAQQVLFGDQDEGCGSIAVQALHSREESHWLLAACATTPSLRGVVAWADLCAPELSEELDALAQTGPLLGLRHLAQDEADANFYDRDDFRRGLEQLADRQLCFDLLVREPQRPSALRLARDFPDQRFVLDHLGKPPVRTGALHPWSAQLREFAACDNVFAKLSGLATEADCKRWLPAQLTPFIELALQHFGPSRLIFGSDWPVCLLAGVVADVVAAHIDPLRTLSKTEFHAITHANAVLAYGLKP
jgi:L-fuconolactonase